MNVLIAFVIGLVVAGVLAFVFHARAVAAYKSEILAIRRELSAVQSFIHTHVAELEGVVNVVRTDVFQEAAAVKAEIARIVARIKAIF